MKSKLKTAKMSSILSLIAVFMSVIILIFAVLVKLNIGAATVMLCGAITIFTISLLKYRRLQNKDDGQIK